MQDGKTIEVDLVEVHIEHEETFEPLAYGLDTVIHKDVELKLEMVGNVREFLFPTDTKELENEKEELIMCRDRICEFECETKTSDDRGENLSAEYARLNLSDDQRLLRKHNIVKLDGTLTEKGKTFLLNLLLEENEEKIVTALQAVEEVREEE